MKSGLAQSLSERRSPKKGNHFQKAVSPLPKFASSWGHSLPACRLPQQAQFGCLVCITSSWPSSSSGTKPQPPHVGHCCSSSVPFSATPFSCVRLMGCGRKAPPCGRGSVRIRIHHTRQTTTNGGRSEPLGTTKGKKRPVFKY